MRCSNCGNELNNGDMFCGNCGQRAEVYVPPVEAPVIPAQALPTKPKNKQPKSNKAIIIAIVFLAVVVIAAAVALILIIGGNKVKTEDPSQDIQSSQESGAVSDSHLQTTADDNQNDTVANFVDANAASQQQQESTPDETVTAADSANGRLLRSFSPDELPTGIVESNSYYEYTPKIVNADDNVNLRSGPGEDYEKIYSVALGSLVYAVADSQDGEWSLIYYRYYNQYGWMANRYIEDVPIAKIDESNLNNGIVTVNGKQFRVNPVNELPCTVTERVGLVLRDNVENGEWLLRMEDGDEIKEICRSSTNPEWGYIEYNDGIRTYKGFAHSDYYSVYK